MAYGKISKHNDVRNSFFSIGHENLTMICHFCCVKVIYKHQVIIIQMFFYNEGLSTSILDLFMIFKKIKK